MNISDRLASELMSHSIDLGRFESHEREVLLRIFRDLETEIVEQLTRIDPTAPTLSTYQRQRAEKLLSVVRQPLRENYTQMARTEAKDLKQLAIQEAALMQTLGAEVVVDGLFSVGVPTATLRAMVDDLVIQGKPLRRWWSTQAQTTLTRYGDTVRAGVLKGDSINEMVRALRGTRERHFTDGVFGQSRRAITTLVRTSVQSVANEARLATFKANADVLKGTEWLTALDAVVCPICRPYSEQAWTLEGKRLPGTERAFPGPPPLHPNCRCHLLPVIRPVASLAKAKGTRFEAAVQALDPEKKAALDGRLAEDVSMSTWLKTQPAAVQRKLLGPEPWKRWQQGKLTLREMVSTATGEPLTLAELLERRGQVSFSLDEILKEGKSLDTELMRQLAPQYKTLNRLETTIRNIPKLMQEAKTPEALEQVSDTYAKAQSEWLKLEDTMRRVQREHVTAALRKVRPVGGIEPKWMPGTPNNVREALADVSQSLPRDWLERSRTHSPLQGGIDPKNRGYYNSGRHEIVLTGLLKNRISNAFHEFGHRFEQVVPDLLKAERQFYEKRTSGPAEANRLRPLGPGYAKDEMTRSDRFVDAYMGKDYGGRNYELFSMGVESIFTGSFDLRGDREFRQFILGLLATL
jgi:SPP1 gp7 family putative phage head morphogenesis protein